MRKQDTKRAEAIATLKNGRYGLKPGDTIFVVFRSQTQTSQGNNDRYSVHQIITDEFGQRGLTLTGRVARIIGYRYNDKSGTVMLGGCGYNKPDAIREELSHALFGDVKALKVETL